MNDILMPDDPATPLDRHHEVSKETILEFEKQNTHVLVVDDEDSVRQLMITLLEDEKIPTTACSSGQDALDWIKREDFGILITDIKLRDFDGMGLLKASKVINPETDVIVVTGYPTVETAVTAMRYGAAEYFTKPFGVEKLRKSVNRLIEKRILERKLRVERHQMEIQRYDVETGFFSNRYFHSLLTHEISRAQRFNRALGLLFIQIAGLRFFAAADSNEFPGDGDQPVKGLVKILRSTCRQTDFLARYSFDEFALILTETDEKGIEIVAKRLKEKIKAMAAELTGQTPDTVLEPVFGWAAYPQAGTSKEMLLDKANASLQTQGRS
jgi:diguanylate cyclase (GGDEF)-like protein